MTIERLSSALSRGVTRPFAIGVVSVAVLGLAYPLVAEPAQQPLSVFVIPILAVSALGTWRNTAVIGSAAVGVAVVEGVLQKDLSATGLTARLTVIVACWLIAIVLSFERGRRQQAASESMSREFLLDVFQDSLVPQPIPPPGVIVDTRYLPGDERLQLGGDFFDAIRLPNGSLGYIIGDVCGQGPRAAAFGAAVRSGWKTLATTTPTDPSHWVRGLDESFFRLGRHSDTFVTLNTGYIEIGEDPSWCFVSAGHPWPIVIHDGPRVLVPSVGPPLGVGVKSTWSVTNASLPPDAIIMLYTDGLTENPLPGGRKQNDGDDRLLAHLSSTQFDIDAVLAAFGPEGFDDDVAVMAIHLGVGHDSDPAVSASS